VNGPDLFNEFLRMNEAERKRFMNLLALWTTLASISSREPPAGEPPADTYCFADRQDVKQ
jgi:hypothetical protein